MNGLMTYEKLPTGAHGWKVDVIMLPESISDKLSRYLREELSTIDRWNPRGRV